MERESTGTKYMVTNCEGSQSPPRAVELRKKKNVLCTFITHYPVIARVGPKTISYHDNWLKQQCF
jgi:hypothetical protein